MTHGIYGLDGYGTRPYGAGPITFGVESALALSQTYVRVIFNDFFDASYPPLLDPANYTIPGLTVLSVRIESALAVVLYTSPQSGILYTVTVTAAHNAGGAGLDPLYRSANFDGVTPANGFFATATARRRVRLTFDVTMLNDSELGAFDNYLVSDLGGTSVPITGVAVESELRSIVFLLGADLDPQQVYTAWVNGHIRTAAGARVFPDTSLFQFNENAVQAGQAALEIPLISFSGEAQGGLFGTSGGLLFFSPALETAIGDSVIQVDEASVCARAYDEYVIPQPVDPSVLYTYGAGHAEGIGGASLWAPFPRLAEARFEFRDLREEPMPQAVDSRCIATYTEPWDKNYVSLLNNTYWKLYDGGATPPAYFITANNLAPIPPGPTVVVVLQP